MGIPMLQHVGLVPYRVMSSPTSPIRIYIEVLEVSANESKDNEDKARRIGVGTYQVMCA